MRRFTSRSPISGVTVSHRVAMKNRKEGSDYIRSIASTLERSRALMLMRALNSPPSKNPGYAVSAAESNKGVRRVVTRDEAVAEDICKPVVIDAFNWSVVVVFLYNLSLIDDLHLEKEVHIALFEL